MTAKVIVFVADRGDQRFGEVSVFERPLAASPSAVSPRLLEHGVHRASVQLRPPQRFHSGVGRGRVGHLYVGEPLGATATVSDHLDGGYLPEG